MAEFTPAPVKPVVGIEAFEALDIRVGTIERVEEIPNSEKLMKLIVNFGDHSRTILAGIKKERENRREIEGRQALFVLNLKPRKIAGEISEGMLFDIGYANGVTPVLSVPERAVPNGTRAGCTARTKSARRPYPVASIPGLCSTSDKLNTSRSNRTAELVPSRFASGSEAKSSSG